MSCVHVPQQTVATDDPGNYLRDLNNMRDLGSHQIWGAVKGFSYVWHLATRT